MNNTDSALIIFFVVMVVAIVIAVIPLYSMVLKGRKADKQHELERAQHELERGRQVLAVVRENSAAIAANTAVIAGLQNVITKHSDATAKALERVHIRVVGQANDIAQINASVAVQLSNQREMVDKIDRLFVGRGS